MASRSVSASELLPVQRCALLAADSPERSIVEKFICTAFRERYGARLAALPPTILALYGPEDRILAAAGLRPAQYDALFLEIYLHEPAHAAISRRVGRNVARGEIVEVGSLATYAPGYARSLIQALTALLYQRGFEWVVFTAVNTLRNTFRRLGLNPLHLAVADPTRLPGGGAEWGSYYAASPEVMYGNIVEGYRRLRGLADSDPASAAISAARALG